MSIEENSRKRKNDAVEDEGVKRKDIELTKFIKHVKLVPEMRHHILTYCTESTLSNYSQCSNITNSEIQIFNTKPPKTLAIKEECDGINVKLWYKDTYPTISVKKKFLFSDNRNTMEEVQKYLLRYYNYVKGTTYCVRVNVKKWPIELMKWKHIANVKKFQVTINKTIYNDCMEYLRSIDTKNKELILHDCDEVADRVIIPADFFKSSVSKNLSISWFFCKSEIDGEDFINMENEHISLRSSINFEDIREKVRRWNSANHAKEIAMTVKLPENDDRVLDLSVIFPSDQFDVDSETDSYCIQYDIGNVTIYLHNDEPKELALHFKKD